MLKPGGTKWNEINMFPSLKSLQSSGRVRQRGNYRGG